MSPVVAIGAPPLSREELVAELEEFAALYAGRPVGDNQGGMKAPHMFLAWALLRKLRPAAIVESGVWKGQGTWLFEQALPGVELVCIDPDLSRLEHRSPRAAYHTEDFARLDLTHLDPERTLLFFDDHQNAYQRLVQARWAGFRHVVFEDNYPAPRGDCYSLKKAFAGVGFEPRVHQPRAVHRRLARALGAVGGVTAAPPAGRVPPNPVDAVWLRRNLGVYAELPPVLRTPTTRWGDAWSDAEYPTAAPLLERVERPWQQVFLDEAPAYNWFCYARLV